MPSRAIAVIAATGVAAACRFSFERPLRPGEIRGRLVYEEPGSGARRPAAGARVRLVGTTMGAVASDEGAFLFRDVPAGTHALHARFDLPLLALERRREILVPAIEIRARPAAAGRKERDGRDLGTLLFGALGTVEGEVRRGDAPIAGAQVVAQGLGTAPTGADGRYTMRLPAGRFELAAVYPGDPGARATAAVTLQLRDRASVDFVASDADVAAAPVEGRALYADRDAHAGIRIRLRAADGTAFEGAEAVATAADGLWKAAEVPAGVYALEASAEGYATLRVSPVGVFPGAAAPLAVLVPRSPDGQADCDRDGTPSPADADDDGDGVPDAEEAAACRCDPLGEADADGNDVCDVAEPPRLGLPLAACARGCGPGEACIGGACASVSRRCDPTCAEGEGCIAGACLDLASASCGGACPPGEVCVRGGCLPDRDRDGRADPLDLCPDDPQASQADADGDRMGDGCDPRPGVPDLVIRAGAALPGASFRRATANGSRAAAALGDWAAPAVLEGNDVRIHSGAASAGGATVRKEAGP